MATRTRPPSARTSKPSTPPPFSGNALEDEELSRAQRGSAPGEAAGNARFSEATDVTNTNLERREIPSFSDSREARIAEAAYWRAERRGFAPGRELDDWLEAEREVDTGEPHENRA